MLIEATLDGSTYASASYPDDLSGVYPRRICRWLSATGAGSGAQNAVGTGVMGGMVTATVAGNLLRAGVLCGDPPLL